MKNTNIGVFYKLPVIHNKSHSGPCDQGFLGTLLCFLYRAALAFIQPACYILVILVCLTFGLRGGGHGVDGVPFAPWLIVALFPGCLSGKPSS